MSWSIRATYPTATSDFLCLLGRSIEDNLEERYAKNPRTICACSPHEADSCSRKTLFPNPILTTTRPRVLAGCQHKR